jgi:hypothetical protein
MLAERADQLAATVGALRAAVTALDERAGHVEARAAVVSEKTDDIAASNKRAIIAIAVVAVFTILGGWLLWANHNTVARLDQVQRDGIALRQDTLCPILQAALANDTAETRSRFAAGPDAHDAFVARIKHGVAAMNCAPLTH